MFYGLARGKERDMVSKFIHYWKLSISGEISEDGMFCKNAVALAYYGSCRLPDMGSWRYLFFIRLCVLTHKLKI